VYVDEKLTQGRNWTIEKSTHEYKKRDANTIRFEVKIEADSTAAIEYTVTETW
jgi:phage protein D